MQAYSIPVPDMGSRCVRISGVTLGKYWSHFAGPRHPLSLIQSALNKLAISPLRSHTAPVEDQAEQNRCGRAANQSQRKPQLVG